MVLKSKSAWSLLVLQFFFIVIFATFAKYGPEADAVDARHNNSSAAGGRRSDDNSVYKHYPMFQDTNVLVFLGIGLLYAFLGKYTFTGIGMNFLLCIICVQWGIITEKWWKMKDGKFEIDIQSFIKGEYAAASGVIALGAIIGKVGLLQMVTFIMIEVLVYSLNNHMRKEYLQVSDLGESVALHLFAAIFGCSTAYAVDRKKNVQGNPNEKSSYNSDTFCMLGAVLLWCYWPSFNAAGQDEDSQNRIIINTFFALMGSGITCFAMSALLSDDSKFTMSDIQNGAIAGAVGVGSTADLMIQPFGALTIGALSGCLCVAGFKYFSPFLARRHVYDPSKINSLHGLPGFFAGVIGAIMMFMANKETYGNSLYKLYPAMASPVGITALDEIQKSSTMIKSGLGRTILSQALYQIIYIIATMGISCLSGLITGVILRVKILDPLEEKYMYLDDIMWKLPDAEANEDSETRQIYSTF